MGGVMSGEKQNTTANKKINSLVVMLLSNKRFLIFGLAAITVVSAMMITLFFDDTKLIPYGLEKKLLLVIPH